MRIVALCLAYIACIGLAACEGGYKPPVVTPGIPPVAGEPLPEPEEYVCPPNMAPRKCEDMKKLNEPNPTPPPIVS